MALDQGLKENTHEKPWGQATNYTLRPAYPGHLPSTDFASSHDSSQLSQTHPLEPWVKHLGLEQWGQAYIQHFANVFYRPFSFNRFRFIPTSDSPISFKPDTFFLKTLDSNGNQCGSYRTQSNSTEAGRLAGSNFPAHWGPHPLSGLTAKLSIRRFIGWSGMLRLSVWTSLPST